MRHVVAICRFIAAEPKAPIADLAIEQNLQVPDEMSDDEVARAAIAVAEKHVAKISAEFGVTFFPLERSEGVFVEIENVD